MIYQTSYDIKNPKATIIIAHGIGEHSGRYKIVAQKLNKAGFNVLTYDHLGHGKSSGKRGKIGSFHQHIDTLHALVLQQKKKSIRPIFLLGHSMGGLIVNLYAVKYQDVQGIISVAAATKTPHDARILKYIGFWYLRWAKISTKRFDAHIAKNPKVLEEAKNDSLGLKYLYLSLIGEMFIKGVKYLQRHISKYETPVIFLHGKKDGIASYLASQSMFDALAIKDKKIVFFEDGYHEILNDYEQDDVLQIIVDWINLCLGY